MALKDFNRLETCVIRKLDATETIAQFDCGDDDLNDFIHNEAALYRKQKLAVSYVYEDQETKEVFAFFSLANDRISLTDFPNNTAFNRFRNKRFKQEKRLKSYPAVKICRLGTSNAAHGKGIGSLLIDSIKTSFIGDNKSGCRFITVDAYAAAVPFYLANGFAFMTEEDADNRTRLLYFDLNELDQ